MKYLPSLSVSSSCRPLNMAANIESLSLVNVDRVVTKWHPPTLSGITRGNWHCVNGKKHTEKISWSKRETVGFRKISLLIVI